MERVAVGGNIVGAESNVEQAMARVAKLDFSILRLKLLFQKGWSSEFIAEAERRYRMFLALRVAYPDQAIPPSSTIDEFWHAHILDTEAYAADCDALFGRFLHHNPYSGMNLFFDRTTPRLTLEETTALFMRHFAVDPFDEFSAPP